jgi:hypothetical protein
MHAPSMKTPKLAVFITLLLSASMAYFHLALFLPHFIQLRASAGVVGEYSFGDDFYPVWLTSRDAVFDHRDPYSAEMTQAIQTGLFGHPLRERYPGDPLANYRVFAYPAYADLVFWPSSLLPFSTVRITLAVVLTILTITSIRLWLCFLGQKVSPSALTIVILLTLSSYAVLEGLFAGQPGLIVGFLLAASFAALIRNRLFLAGTLLSFTFIKPQMSAIVAVYLLLWSMSDWRKRRVFVLGLAAWSTLLLAASLIVWPHWIAEWLHVLSGYGGYSQPPTRFGSTTICGA